VLRIGFVIASLVFLGGFGGPILYVLAWLLIPEEGKDAPVNRAMFSGRPWQDWDRSARSWALVLGSLALALIWSFGIWPWWHWRVLPFWLAGLGVALWLLARHRDGGWATSSPQTGPPQSERPAPRPGPAPGTGPGQGPWPGYGPAAPGPVGTGPTAEEPTAPAAGAPSTSGDYAAASVATMTAPVAGHGHNADGPGDYGENAHGENGNGQATATMAGPETTTGANGTPAGPAATGPATTDDYRRGTPSSPPNAAPTPSTLPQGADLPAGPVDPTEADWVMAKSAAADWAAGQLALAGVPAKSGHGDATSTSPAAAPATRSPLPATAARSVRRAVRLLVALITALVLLAILTVVAVTLGTGSSLRGGVGDSALTPASLGAVQPLYRLGAGNLNLNFSNVQFPPSGKAVDVTLGLGNLTIEVPKDALVTVQARTGIGQVDVFGQTGSDIQTTSYPNGTAASAPDLDLDAHVGIGDLQVTRG